jgi:serine/threonine protein kinase/WD40 repeat protein/Tfp pilus assembly protein PilF
MSPEPFPRSPADGVSSESDPLDGPAEEFLARYRRGERPALTEYEERFPALAQRIRALFPTLVEMERAGSLPGDGPAVPGIPAHPGDGAPARIGEFRILRTVGAGGMGVVYEAVQESLSRHVALKVLTPNRRESYLERFRREARAAAKLHHTNIVPVFGVGEADGVHFYAMQFIPGQGLDSVLDEVRRIRAARSSGAGRATGQSGSAVAPSVAESLVAGSFAPSADPPAGGLPPSAAPADSQAGHSELAGQPDARYYREVARIGVQVAEALAHAHEQGVLHRDIKPSNLLLDLHGTAWVTDFGLAKADDEQDLTRTGDIVGTLRYMAPERFRGHADARSEVYALGVTLYELLTLRPAFEETDRLALIEHVCHTSPVRPRKIDRQIPRDLETVVLKAIARDPADRYASAAALADDLRRFLTDRTIAARRASAPERLWRWARRNPAVALLLTVILVGSVSAAVVFAVQRDDLRVALKQSEDDRGALTVSQGNALARQREAQLKQLDSMISEARATTLGRKPGQRFASLALLDRATALARELGVLNEKSADLRNAVAAALAVTDLHVGQSWASHPDRIGGFDVSGDHAVYAWAAEDGTCVVTRVADGAEVCRVPWAAPRGPPPPVAPAGFQWSPTLSDDGRTLLLLESGEVHVWRVGPPAVRVAVARDALAADLRPDGRRFVVSHTDGSLSVYDLPDGRLAGRFPALDANGPVIPVLHPSEPRVVLSRFQPRLAVVRDTRTGEVVGRLDGFKPSTAAWHPDGTTLVVMGDQNELRVFDTKTFRQTAVWLEAGTLHRIRFNPSGDRLAGVLQLNQVCLIDAHTGRRLHTSPPFRDGVALRWSGDGRRLAGPAFGGRIGIWEVGDGREFRALHHWNLLRDEDEGHFGVHPKGRLVVARERWTFSLTDLDTGRHLTDLPQGAETHWQAVFDPAGAIWAVDSVRTLRWPVREDAARPGRFTIGPPEQVPINLSRVARSADGRVWVGQPRGRLDLSVWRTDRPHDPVVLPAAPDLGRAVVSPDGRWAVTVGRTTTDATLWDLRAGRPERRLYTYGGNALPGFSPDGKWLWVNTDGGRLLHVGTWEPGPVTGRGEGRPAFTADGRVLALETGAGSVRLVRTSDGRELVRLDNPHQHALDSLAFTPDGGRLVGYSAQSPSGVYVWELRLIRRQLAARGLDWEDLPIPDPPAPAGPIEVRIPIATPAEQPAKDENPLATLSRMTAYLLHDPDLADPHHYRAHAWERLEMAGRAEADFDEAVRLRPGDPAIRECRAVFRFDRGRYAEAAADLDRVLADAPSWSPPVALLNKVAFWHLVLAPAGGRDPAKGLDLARRAVDRDPKAALPRVALGVALLRAGRPAEAVKELDLARRDSTGRFDDLACPALALAHLAQGDRQAAADALRRAADARARLSGRRLPAHLQLARGALESESLAAYAVGLLRLTLVN